MVKKHIVTWKMLQLYSKKLAYQIISIKSWTKIIAVSRGGLIPCALLARELSIRYVDTLCISSYHYNSLKTMKIIKKSNIDDHDVLIIDDLVDTGGTARVIRKMYPKSYFVTIFAKPMGRYFVDNYIVDIPQDVWIEQPWDMDKFYIPPLVEEPIFW